MKNTLILLLFYINFSSIAQQGFVTIKNGQFMADGQPYRYIGTNMWYGCYLGANKVPDGRERLVRELDFLKKQGITNIRILGASEASSFGNYLPFAIQSAPTVYDESLLDGLDFMLAEMGKRDMRAVVYLNNYWNWSGGMGQYITWHAPDLAASVPETPGKKWEREMKLSSLFYGHENAQAHYQKYISTLINRTNTFTQRQYKDDPTIMAWQLGNEPRPGLDGPHGEAYVQDFIKWIDKTAAFIQSQDKNHLVSSGNEGKTGTLQNSSYYEQSHQSSNIDYLTVHIWPKNWSWFDADNPTESQKISVTKSLDYLQEHIDIAQRLGKPLVLEEFGLDRDNKQLQPGSSTKLRDGLFEALFKRIYSESIAGKTIAGANFWAWGGEGTPQVDVNGSIPSSAFVGDPFIEPQGLNSVFSNDKKTLKVIRQYNRKLATIDK